MRLGFGTGVTDVGYSGGVADAADGGAFDPLSLTPTAFYQVSDLSTLFVERTAHVTPASVNGVVGTVLDKSGNGWHLTAAADSRRPILRQSGSFFYLEFDGVDDALAVSFTLNQPVTRIGTGRQVTWTSGDRIWDGSAGNSAGIFQTGVSPALTAFAGSSVAIGSVSALGTDFVLTENWNGASSRFAVNNNAYTTGNPGTAAQAGFCVGAFGPGSSSFANIFWYGHIIASRILTDTETANSRRFCGNLAGLSL